jgi:hypothetical protein
MEIMFSRVIGEHYLKVCDRQTPIIMIVFVISLWAKSQDHQQDNQHTFFSLQESNVKTRSFYSIC